MDKIKKIQITRIKEGKSLPAEESLCPEEQIHVYLNNQKLISLMCYPDKIKELILGFIYLEDILETQGNLKDIVLDKKENAVYCQGKFNKKAVKNLRDSRTITTGCNKGVTGIDFKKPEDCKRINTSVRYSGNTLIDIAKRFNRNSDLFLKTGAVHSVGLYDKKGNRIAFAEDIGRHNAFDKVVGEILFNNIKLDDKILFTSGRISSEIMAKTIKAKIPVIISRAAPTFYAYKLAENFFITLIGFIRGEKMNIYTYPERIVK
jgi:FdhD protein